MEASASGVLNVDKPEGMTSRDVVDRVEERCPGAKVGHGGTLDRMATGVLPMLFNEATKLVPYLHQQPKTYHVTARFDRRSDTLDTDGDLEPVGPDREPEADRVEEALVSFEGDIEQVPPEYSAIKIDGERMSDRVERGEDVDPEARTVTCYETEVRSYTFPRLQFEVTCGKGFYVRSLVRDLVGRLDLSAGVVASLTRTRYGPLVLSGAVDLGAEDWEPGWHPPVDLVEDYRTVNCDEENLKTLRHGSRIPRRDPGADWAAAVDSRGRLHAMLRAEAEHGLPKWQPDRVLNRRPARTQSG